MPFRYYIYIIFLGIPLLLVLCVGMFWYLPIWFCLLVPLVMGFFFVKLRRQRMVLRLIYGAIESETSIPDVLGAYAAGCWGPWYRAKVSAFADLLRRGNSLAVAALACRGVLRYDAVALLEMGAGPELIGDLIRHASKENRVYAQFQSQSIFQLSWMAGYIPLLVLVPMFYMFAIIPKMEAIFKDFDMELPFLTIFVIAMSNGIVKYFFLFVPLALFLICAPFAYFLLRSGIFPWRPPGVRKIFRRIDAARFLRVLSTGLELKKPMPEVVSVYEKLVPSFYLRDRGNRFNTLVAQGMNWLDSLRKIGWITADEQSLLEASIRAENTPAMLRELADEKEHRQLVADNSAGRLVFFVFLLCIGVMVAMFSFAFFLPLVKLIGDLSF